MTYKELKDILDGLNDIQLAKDVMVWNTTDQDMLHPIDYEYNGKLASQIAEDRILDEDQTYFIF